MLGDNAYYSGTDEEYQAAVYDMYSTMLRKLPLWSCLGNHDTGEGGTSIHANHPRELTTEVRKGLGILADHGVPLGNQSVLLRGVNDEPEIMKSLVHKLLMCRVRPYYLYQCDLIKGSSHLRASVAKGIEIIETLRGHTTGYAVPQFVIDAPGGGGKVPLNPDYVLVRDEQRVLVRNYEGKVFEYPEPGAQPALTTPSELSTLVTARP